jgi:hypothetical protein
MLTVACSPLGCDQVSFLPSVRPGGCSFAGRRIFEYPLILGLSFPNF